MQLCFQCANSIEEFRFNKKRVRILTPVKEVLNGAEGIVYWMSRDQRVQGRLHYFYMNKESLLRAPCCYFM